MMMFLLATLSILQPAASVGKADRPQPAPPMEVKADAILTVLTAPEKSRWKLIDRDGADLVASPDGKTAVFAALAKGRYRVVVITGETDVDIVVVVGDVPAPTPPKPGPVDPVIPPTDPLTAKLQAAYKLDTRADAAKQVDLKDLVELYKQAAEFASKPDIASLAELVAKVKDAAKALGIEGLVDCRKAIADELKLAFANDAPFDDASRLKAKVLFVKLSEALKNVK